APPPAPPHLHTPSLHDALPISAAGRNRAFGRYSLTGGLFNAAGGLSAAVLSDTRVYFLLFAAIGLVTAALPLVMSKQVEGEPARSEEHTSELQSLRHLVCRLLL